MTEYEFAYHFMKRHKDLLRTKICQQIKRSRASVSTDDINKYFDHLQEDMRDVPPSNIFNFDETNISDDSGRKKVISKNVDADIQKGFAIFRKLAPPLYLLQT